MFVRRMFLLRLVLHPLFKKMEEVGEGLQGKVVLYHVMISLSLKSSGVVHYYRIMCFLLKKLLVKGRGKLSSG